MPTAIRAAGSAPLSRPFSLPFALPVPRDGAALRTMLFGALLQAAGLLLSAHPVAETAPAALEPVAALDLARYAGVWYEIARSPAPDDAFANGCARDVSLVYRPADDGSLAVLEQCVGADGLVQRRDGVARPDTRAARFEESYQPALLRALPSAWSDARVVHLDPDYQLAALTDGVGSTLRILARSPQAAADAYRALVDRLERRGLPARHLLPVDHAARNP